MIGNYPNVPCTINKHVKNNKKVYGRKSRRVIRESKAKETDKKRKEMLVVWVDSKMGWVNLKNESAQRVSATLPTSGQNWFLFSLSWLKALYASTHRFESTHRVSVTLPAGGKMVFVHFCVDQSIVWVDSNCLIMQFCEIFSPLKQHNFCIKYSFHVWFILLESLKIIEYPQHEIETKTTKIIRKIPQS